MARVELLLIGGKSNSRRIYAKWPPRAMQACRAPQEEMPMITEYVLFPLPEGISREEVVEGMREVAPKWRANKDLIRKTYVYDAEARMAGAFYLWKNRAAAEAAHDAAWRESVRKRYGGEPQIRYFDTPLVVDNLVGETIEA
jgi:hypothetical protein